MDKRVQKALIKATKRSTHRRHQTGCVIVSKKGEILTTGCSHASSLRMSELHSIHAEIHALGRGRYENLKGATAYICTMARKSGNFVYSAPCLTCAIALKVAGINEVIYSNGDNHPMKQPWNEMKIEDTALKNLKVYPRRIN
jgi:deoxycytidylate deaminase